MKKYPVLYMILINGNHDTGDRVLFIYGVTNIPKLKDFKHKHLLLLRCLWAGWPDSRL